MISANDHVLSLWRAEKIAICYRSKPHTRQIVDNPMNKPVITRFAPSPTGRLHLGHLYAAGFARQCADAHGGQMRLRIEDIDHTRCRAEFYDGIIEDLAFMGIAYDGAVLVQSDRMAVYQARLDDMKEKGWIYPCHLTRRELDALLSAPHDQTATPIANTDQMMPADVTAERQSQGQAPAWRLRMEAIRPLIKGLDYQEQGQPPQQINPDHLGDEVIARKDIGTSYHLSVVIDDAETGVTHVTRVADLKEQTPLHRILQVLLDCPETIWAHHDLIADEDGKRLAKRAASVSIAQLRDHGLTRDQIKEKLAMMPKITR